VSVTLSADLAPNDRHAIFVQCGDASLGNHTGPQTEKDGGQLVVLADLSHACHTKGSRRLPSRRDFPAGKTSRMATTVHDGDVSTGH
jgi:hypothetical protein